ncbi:hypothetical protein C8R45DRAFT_635901 [Mycena sanguinolenta]|nr:hypothetical protein C8R45DRAFT_635901 [Mycena sanguinolenta]
MFASVRCHSVSNGRDRASPPDLADTHRPFRVSCIVAVCTAYSRTSNRKLVVRVITPAGVFPLTPSLSCCGASFYGGLSVTPRWLPSVMHPIPTFSLYFRHLSDTHGFRDRRWRELLDCHPARPVGRFRRLSSSISQTSELVCLSFPLTPHVLSHFQLDLYVLLALLISSKSSGSTPNAPGPPRYPCPHHHRSGARCVWRIQCCSLRPRPSRRVVL